MSNVWRLFTSDLKRIGSNVVTIIIVLGLVALPSLFSWYNIIACWDVFGNTGNLTVAVANNDEGYTSDLAPFEVNIGDQVTSALRANDQLNWVFTNADDAIDGARSGRYYAAVVIPASFSSDMMSFYSRDVEHAQIVYYSNQKKSAIAPKVTDQGADQVAAQVNEVFAETVSEIALGISTALLDYADDADVSGRVGDLASHVQRAGTQVADSAVALESYTAVLESARALVDDSGDLLGQTRDKANAVTQSAADARDASEAAVNALRDSSATLSAALQESDGRFESLAAAVGAAYDQASQSAGTAEAQLRSAAETLRQEASQAAERAEETRNAVESEAEAAVENAPEGELRADLEEKIAGKPDDSALRSRYGDMIEEAADRVAQANGNAQQTRAEAEQELQAAREQLAQAKQGFADNLETGVGELADAMSEASEAVNRVGDLLDSASAELTGSADAVSERLGAAIEGMDGASSNLRESAENLSKLAADVTDALNSDDAQMLRTVIGDDPSQLAAALAAPVQLDRVAVYPVDNFGSAMSPLYTTLALWIGSLLLLVTLKVQPSARTLAELDSPTARQVFTGRFLTIALVSLMQSTVLSLGNLLFLGVQAVEPLLYVLCFWVAGLVFTFIIYTMVALFANLGKALGVVLLIVQVSGGGGSFPLQLLPSFFQNMSPYLPITHAVRAMRAAMFGLYNGDFWIELGTLLLFIVPFAVMGLVLLVPLGKIVPRFIERVEASKLM